MKQFLSLTFKWNLVPNELKNSLISSIFFKKINNGIAKNVQVNYAVIMLPILDLCENQTAAHISVYRHMDVCIRRYILLRILINYVYLFLHFSVIYFVERAM